jgi:hypothetical protein
MHNAIKIKTLLRSPIHMQNQIGRQECHCKQHPELGFCFVSLALFSSSKEQKQPNKARTLRLYAHAPRPCHI